MIERLDSALHGLVADTAAKPFREPTEAEAGS
jgi:hypothetical protein